MSQVRFARSAALSAVVFAGTLLANPSFAAVITVTPVFEFSNFYTPFAYGTDTNLPDDLVTNFVNGQQLCPVSGTFTPYPSNCRQDGEAYTDLAPGTQSVSFRMLDFGAPVFAENVITFTPGPTHDVVALDASDKFLFGSLTFTNGVWSAGVRLSYDLEFDTGDPALNALFDFEETGVLVLQGTNNLPTNSPAQNADLLYLEEHQDLGSLRAYELADSPTGTNTVSVDIYGYLGSVHYLDFENVRGGGFIDAGVNLEPTPVPEPATSQLILVGGILLLGFRLRGRSFVTRRG